MTTTLTGPLGAISIDSCTFCGWELQLHPRASNLVGPDGAGDTVEDSSSDEERDTTDAETDAETTVEESWCPRCPTRQTTLLRVRSLVLPTSSKPFFFLWYGRSRSKARSLHQTKLLVVRTRGTLCWTVWSAREQQSLRTWIVSFFLGSAVNQLAHSSGEWSLFWISGLLC